MKEMAVNSNDSQTQESVASTCATVLNDVLEAGKHN